MRRLIGTCLVTAAIVALAVAAPAAAATRKAIVIDAVTTFDDVDDAFTSNLDGCGTGIVSNGDVHVEFKKPLNIFAGYKVFDCGGGTGFVMRLNARFGDGSVGTWAVVDAWGSVAGMTGAGPLTGEPIDNGILDHYRGTATFR